MKSLFVDTLSRENLILLARDKMWLFRHQWKTATRKIDRKRAKEELKDVIRLLRLAGGVEDQVKIAERLFIELFPKGTI